MRGGCISSVRLFRLCLLMAMVSCTKSCVMCYNKKCVLNSVKANDDQSRDIMNMIKEFVCKILKIPWIPLGFP